MPAIFRHAVCNEIYKDWDFAESCAHLRSIGYTGIEIAPFTLAEDPATITSDRRREYRRVIEDSGLRFVGLHWLMVSPKGLHATTPDTSLRERSWAHIRNLIDLCADLGHDGIMVFGSPQQRASTGGLTREEATRHYIEGVAAVAPHAESRRVTILVEALPPSQCDVVQSLEEAVDIVRQVGSPAVRTMFDTHNAAEERESHAELLDRYFDYIRHVHVNEMDGRHPTPGGYDFKPVLSVLKKRDYQGWVSLEAFDFTPGAEAIAKGSLRYLEAECRRLPE